MRLKLRPGKSLRVDLEDTSGWIMLPICSDRKYRIHSWTLQATTLERVDIDGNYIGEGGAAKYLIESVSARDIGTGQLRYSVRTVSGDDPAQWEDYFLELKNASKTTQFDNTVTLALTEALGTDTFDFNDSESEAIRLMSTDPYVISNDTLALEDRSFIGYAEVM